MTKQEKEEQDAVKMAQLLKKMAMRLVSPSYREMRRLEAQERRIKFLAHIEAGFTEAQALQLCKE